MISPLFALGLALGPLWFYCRTTDEVLRLSLSLNCLFFLTLSILTSPWPLRVVILVGVLSLAQTHLK